MALAALPFFGFGQDSIPCNSERFDDPFLEKLVGNWQASGTVMADSVRYRITAKWVLMHQFLEISMLDAATPPQYSAQVFIGYDCLSERYVAHWLDNFGGRFSETLGFGEKNGQQIAFRFEYPNGPLVNNFIFSPPENIWRMYSKVKTEKNDWVVFGDIRLAKMN